ncbi:MAG: Ribosomal protein S4 [Candidatus Methanohalarchaeum thermophilum]|uniref:Small ribosomal subunit protein uS4 n=1 Tax=Methanohalarchaeum thermophilum TaxID=1903181 RepID=A0A1Q6DX32_METT1|nr:MAG: Ribosomal protein S4 [Candidatus Methanohalarchaeum thermophilum]
MPRGSGKQYETPPRPWQQDRMESESRLIENYGLKNKKELWRAESKLRKYRREARNLLAEIGRSGKRAQKAEKEKEEFLTKLKKYGLVTEDASLDDVLALDTRRLLQRRLQTQVHKKGLATSIKQARQFIVHGHIAVDGKKVTIPSYKIKKDQEQKIEYYTNSPLNNEQHPEKPEKVKEE